MHDEAQLRALDAMPGAEVRSPDGQVGTLAMLGVKPQSDEITHLIVRRGFMFQRELLVPKELVTAVEPEANCIQLSAPLSQILHLPEYQPAGGWPGLIWGLVTLPARLTFDLALGRWRHRRYEVQDRMIHAARRARTEELRAHKVFDQAVDTLPLELDLNRASAEELTLVRGIGPSLAEQIIAHRPYASLEELSIAVPLSERTLERLAEIARF